VLDVATGSGRHAAYFADRGHPVVAVDRDTAHVRPRDRIRVVRADLEDGAWPLAAGVFSGVVVANYLWRPLFEDLLGALNPGGVLIYETFAAGNERFGKPSNPAYLLCENELIAFFGQRLRVEAFEQGQISAPRAAVVQRICAVRSE